MCFKRQKDEHTDLNEYGICSGCDKLFELRLERRIFDGETIFWLCPRCNAVSDDTMIVKKKEWELSND